MRCGEPIAPAASTTSRVARNATSAPATRASIPVARRSPFRPSIRIRRARAWVTMSRFARPRAGRRNPRAVFQRIPVRWFTWK